MADRFIEQSKEIANNFIQNIVFIDDKAYKEDSTNNAFSALDVSNAFAKTGKICAIYAPKSVSDIDSYDVILKKADVVILDWYLNIERDEEQQLDPDADAEILGTIPAGAEVMIDESESTDDFYNVCAASGFEGFCMKQFVEV